MKGHVAAFLAGIGTAAGAVFTYDRIQRTGQQRGTGRQVRRSTIAEESRQPRSGRIDLNTAAREQLASLGIADGDMLDRIIENRPYRNKLDLVSRMIVTQDVYDLVKDRIAIDGANDAIKVAS